MILKIELSNIPAQMKEQNLCLKIDLERKTVSFCYEIAEKSSNTSELPLTMQHYIEEMIKEKTNMGHVRTAETYQTALNSFNRFCDGHPVLLSQITPSYMSNYEAYLKNAGICMNTISYYMRKLKTVYRRAVFNGLVPNMHPFSHVYTGVAKTQKRAICLDEIRKIKTIEPIDNNECFARDLFLFSFYTHGMAFVDMAYLRRKDICNGILHYSRRKTGQTISIKWDKHMQAIVDAHPSTHPTYILPIIKKEVGNERNQLRYIQYLVNQSLKTMGKRLNLPCALTMYVARHSWASIAKSINIPTSIISEAMGHTSERMTTIYLKSLDESRVHVENQKIIDLIEGC